jgi:hypothetical protein
MSEENLVQKEADLGEQKPSGFGGPATFQKQPEVQSASPVPQKEVINTGEPAKQDEKPEPITTEQRHLGTEKFPGDEGYTG